MPRSPADDAPDEFLESVTEFQPRLYGYIFSLVADREAAHEILQETNVVLWRKSEEFELGSNFKAWSFRIAYFQFLAYQQRQVRERLVFDEASLQRVAAASDRFDDSYHERRDRLEECLRRLPQRQRELIVKRYLEGVSIDELAVETKRTSNAISQLLFRARRNLLDCLKPSETTG